MQKYFKKKTLIHFSQAMTEQMDKTIIMDIKLCTGNREYFYFSRIYRMAIKLIKSQQKTVFQKVEVI